MTTATSRIHVLSEAVANRIAAGEVVERPASVIKELVENALDAGALHIVVEIRQGGLALMRVSDDGGGMTPAEAPLAFHRHATSKIVSAEDLDSIQTLGFRGEALPSIASVAKVELITRTSEQDLGTRLVIEGGALKSQDATGCAVGTTLIVRELFFNTPARRKFMKSQTTEQTHIVQVVEMAALANSHTGFKLIVDGREFWNCPATERLEDRLASLYRSALPEPLLPLEREGGGVWIRGLLAGPEQSRGTRQGLKLFINGRPVDHRGLSHAVIQAYRPALPEARFPVVFIFIEMPPDLVDVNVHPSKREVRLRDERGMHELLLAAIRDALQTLWPSGSEPHPVTQAQGASTPGPRYPTPGLDLGYSATRVQEAVHTYYQHPDTPTADRPSYTRDQLPGLHALGQIGQMYLVAQDESGLILVDQHALHERILYEEYRSWAEGEIPRQSLLLPITMELEPSQLSDLTSLVPFFEKLGIEISPMGGTTITIQTKPQNYSGSDLAAVIRQVLDGIAEHGNILEPIELQNHLFKSLACHAAIKAGERLQPETIRYLLEQMRHLPGAPTCPHGRPFVFRLTWTDLEKRFKRT